VRTRIIALFAVLVGLRLESSGTNAAEGRFGEKAGLGRKQEARSSEGKGLCGRREGCQSRQRAVHFLSDRRSGFPGNTAGSVRQNVHAVADVRERASGREASTPRTVAARPPIMFPQAGKKKRATDREEYALHGPRNNSPMRRAVAHSFSDSILGATKVESLPHPERKRRADRPGSSAADGCANDRVPTGGKFPASRTTLTRKTATFGMVKGRSKRNVEIETVGHYATDHPPVPPLLPPGTPPPPTPPPPRKHSGRAQHAVPCSATAFSELPQAGFRPRLGG